MSTTITGNIKDLSATAVPGATKTFVRFWLRGANGQQPRVNGTALVAPKSGLSFYFDMTPDASGAISGTLYSTRDVTGTGNGEIEVGGSLTSVWYGMQVYNNGAPGPEIAFHAKNSATVDISNVTSLTTTPMATAPTGDTTYLRLDGGNSPVTGSVAFTAAVTADKINNHIFVDGTKYPITQAGIQSAITDACAISSGAGKGCHVWLPPCSVALTNGTGSTEQFLVTAPIQVHGAGPNATWFVVGSTTGIDSIPIFRIVPAASDEGYYLFEDFRITANATNGGDAFSLEATASTTINDFTLRRTKIVNLAAGSWAVTMNTAGGTERFFHGRITDNNLAHGIKMNSTSTIDSWLIDHNVFTSVSGVTTAAVDATTVNGAAHVTLFNNNGSLPGGFCISHGTTELQILYNQIEQAVTSVEANSALIDLMGDTYTIDHAVIVGNNIGSNNNCSINIRVDHATRTWIAGNVIGVNTSSGTGIVLTANSSGTVIDNNNSNEFILGGSAVAMTNASGVNPFTVTLYTSTGTLPATIKNDSAGGVQILTNNGKSWDFQNTSNLVAPAGVGITLPGATSGNCIIAQSAVAGGTHTFTANGGNINETMASVDSTAQSAATGTLTAFAVVNAGQYHVSWNAKITQAATSSSTLGPMTLGWTDPDGTANSTVVSATVAAGSLTVSGQTTNTTAVFMVGTPLTLNCKAGTNITYSFAYASSGATAMQYNLHIKVQAI